MVGCQFFKKIAATVAVSGMLLSFTPALMAAQILRNGDVQGVIRSNSPTYRFRNESRTGSAFQNAPGEEYIFNAQAGDTIQASVQIDDNSNLAPVLVLISSQTGRQVAYDDSSNSIQYRVPTTGEYRLLVLGQNYSRGRYTLSFSGISDDGVSQNPYNQPSSNRGRDQRRQFLRNEYGLRVLDRCPGDRSSLVAVTFNEYGQTNTYCAYPNRSLQAGEYVYNPSSNEIEPAGDVGQNPYNQGTSTYSERRLLQNQFGLRVLDSCPASRRNLVVANVPDDTGEYYTYCAYPNRSFPAGEYTYNPDTRNLEAGTSTSGDRCTFQLGGVCIFK